MPAAHIGTCWSSSYSTSNTAPATDLCKSQKMAQVFVLPLSLWENWVMPWLLFLVWPNDNWSHLSSESAHAWLCECVCVSFLVILSKYINILKEYHFLRFFSWIKKNVPVFLYAWNIFKYLQNFPCPLFFRFFWSPVLVMPWISFIDFSNAASVSHSRALGFRPI